MNHRINTADIICYADSKYRLWINGIHVGVGPARGCPDRPCFDAYDATPFLRKGRNVVAFLVEHYTSGSIIFSPVQGALLCELTINDKSLASTDSSWKCRTAESYRVIGKGYHHFEVFDAGHFPERWFLPDFDDTHWLNANVLKHSALPDPAQLQPRRIPHLTHKVYYPQHILSAGLTDVPDRELHSPARLSVSLKQMTRTNQYHVNTIPVIAGITPYPDNGICIKPTAHNKSVYLEIDFGEELLGPPAISVESSAGLIIDMGYSETLEDNKINPFRQQIFYADRIITKKGITSHSINQPRGFRYMLIRMSNIRSKVHISELYAIEEIYPALNQGYFLSSDKTFNAIHTSCLRTMNLCLEDSYTDCPWRERQQWLGDMLVESLTTLYGLGGIDITRKAILEFAQHSTKQEWFPSVTPGGNNLNLPTFGMLFPAIVWNYYMYTGEEDILNKTFDSIKRMDSYIRTITDQMGFVLTNKELSQRESHVWHFVDWTKTDSENSDGVLQGIYLYFLKTCSRIARELNQSKDSVEFERRAKQLGTNIAKCFWSKENECFLKYRLDGTTLPPGTPARLIGQHENFIFTLLDIGTEAKRKKALKAIAGYTGKYLPDLGGLQSRFSSVQKGSVANQQIIQIGSPFFSYFAIESLLAAGSLADAFDYIRTCWGYMLDNGSGTCWEMWGGETSRCHGFSTSPSYFFYAYILGISPLEPGFSCVKVAPRLIDLSWAEGRIPVKQGNIFVRWDRTDSSQLKAIVDLPQKTKACFYIPEEYSSFRRIYIDGTGHEMIPVVELESGRHDIVVKEELPAT